MITGYVYDHELMDGDDLNDNTEAIVATHEADTYDEVLAWFSEAYNINDFSLSFTVPADA